MELAMNRRLLAVVLGILVAVSAVVLTSVAPSWADDEPAGTDHDRWMAAKLVASQNIVADLTHGDFESLEENARRMQVINLLEQWMRDSEFERKSEYEGQLNSFEFATKELVRHAGDRNTEGALQAYLDMTASCVHCHELIRDPLEN
jgi:hypothetical protein